MSYIDPARFTIHPEVARLRHRYEQTRHATEQAATRLQVLQRAVADREAEITRKLKEHPDQPLLDYSEVMERGNGHGVSVVYHRLIEPEEVEAATERLRVAQRNESEARAAWKAAEESTPPYDLVAALTAAGTRYFARRPLALDGGTAYPGEPLTADRFTPPQLEQLLRVGMAGEVELRKTSS